MFQGALDRSADKVFHFTSILRKCGGKLYLIPASTIADLKRKSPFFFFFYSCLFIVAGFLYGETQYFSGNGIHHLTSPQGFSGSLKVFRL